MIIVFATIVSCIIPDTLTKLIITVPVTSTPNTPSRFLNAPLANPLMDSCPEARTDVVLRVPLSSRSLRRFRLASSTVFSGNVNHSGS
jgi:hypothetical protein